MISAIRAASTRKKVFAILAAGLVVGIGGTMTLASWTDTEWAYGGNGAGGPGVGTSTFQIDQDATNPFVAPGTFTNHDTNPGNSLSFGVGALALTPGDVVYAPVAITSIPNSIAGTVVLNAAVPATGVATNDPATLLGNTLHLSIGVISEPLGTVPPTCNLAGFGAFTPLLTDATGIYSAPAATAEALTVPPAAKNVLHYCFKIQLPATATSTAFQGLTVAPAWSFTGTSS
jgi:predicted ribosomally synthesized peptide with SipW-like signal peptide